MVDIQHRTLSSFEQHVAAGRHGIQQVIGGVADHGCQTFGITAILFVDPVHVQLVLVDQIGKTGQQRAASCPQPATICLPKITANHDRPTESPTCGRTLSR